MPIVQPNPVSLLAPTQSSAGSLKDPANQVLRKGSKAPAPLPDICQMVAQALVSAQIQIDPIVQALRNAIPNSNLYQVLDSQGNLQAQLGDMVGVDNASYSGLWALRLFLGGKGPGDPNGVVIEISGGAIILPLDLEVINLTVDNNLGVGNNLGVTANTDIGGDLSVIGNASAQDINAGGDIGALGDVSAAGDLSGATAHVSGQANLGAVVTGNIGYAGGLTFTGGIPSIGGISGNTLTLANNANLVSGVYQVASVQVVGPRHTGWTAPTGTVSRATFDQSTVTLAQLAQRVAALELDLLSHGLIGT